MQDYIPQDPNRKKLIHADGTVEYVHIESADNPIANNPTPLNKATLLSDETAALFGLPNTAVPDEVLKLASNATINGATTLLSVHISNVSANTTHTFNLTEAITKFSLLFISLGMFVTGTTQESGGMVNFGIYAGGTTNYIITKGTGKNHVNINYPFSFFSVCPTSGNYTHNAQIFEDLINANGYPIFERDIVRANIPNGLQNPEKVTIAFSKCPINDGADISILGVRR